MNNGWLAIRCEKGEKVIYHKAAKARGMTLSAFTRAVLDKAALEVLRAEVETDDITGKLRAKEITA